MKKTLTFVIALLACCMLSAKSSSSTALLFNRPQFQPHEYNCNTGYDRLLLTVPLVYKGTVALTIESLANDKNEIWNTCTLDENCKAERETETHCCYVVDTAKKTLPVFMTICQPCIDCFPCFALEKEASDQPIGFVDDKIFCEAKPGKITKWNLYYVVQDKKAKETTISKINLLDDAYETEFFTGRRGSKPGFIYVGGYGNLFMVGKKSDFTFKYYEAYLSESGDWVSDGSLKQATAYIKSMSSIAGTTAVSVETDALDADCDVPWEGAPAVAKINASFKLSRDAALTKKAVNETFSTTFAKKGKNWEDCNVATPASYCEEYFLVEDGDHFDEYLEGAYGKKGWDYELVLAEDILMDQSSDESSDKE